MEFPSFIQWERFSFSPLQVRVSQKQFRDEGNREQTPFLNQYHDMQSVHRVKNDRYRKSKKQTAADEMYI